MTDDHFECPELSGKIVKNLKLYKESPDRCEVMIEFTDGTSFSCVLDIRSTIIGIPEVLREYLS